MMTIRSRVTSGRACSCAIEVLTSATISASLEQGLAFGERHDIRATVIEVRNRHEIAVGGQAGGVFGKIVNAAAMVHQYDRGTGSLSSGYAGTDDHVL